MTKREKIKANFWFGFFAHAALLAMIQDWMGVDRYVATVRSGWVNTPWWVGAIGLGVALCAAVAVERKPRSQSQE